ncbi:MAG: DNA polymerase III subunit gamma/tau [Planctomycetota bacterium]|jgi:DNA polymerase-3 subunit gamma/tau
MGSKQTKAADAKDPAAQDPGSEASSSYTVLARRYRPRDFDGLVGQDPIAKTLRNAVASKRLAHAYLFSGSRGVGKTSMARILAKAINATGDLEQADEIAEAILRGDDLDVIEIDGASNRGINEAKDLIAAAVLSPARCPKKIYIIDEVHMLTREAFNALLKTMEEPPRHVKFILCTTEPHKVPATIRSRCQQFDFRLLSTAEIAGQLRKILEDERMSADEQVVAQVARLGRGSMRDALSLLDRLLAAGEQKLTTDLLEQMLGLPDQALAARLVDAIADSDPPKALEAGAALLDRGASVEQALEMLIEHLRNLLLVATCGPKSELIELSEDARRGAVEQARRFDAPGLVHMIALADAVARGTRDPALKRALFDAAVVRMCLTEQLADVAALLGGDRPAASAAGASKKKEAVTRGPKPPPAHIVEAKTAPLPPGAPGAELWASVQALAAEMPADRARLEHLVFESFDGRRLRLAVDTPDAGLGRWLATQAEPLAEMVRRATSRDVVVEIDTSATESADGPQAVRARIEEAQQSPLVRRAMEIFDATVVDVQEAAAPGPAPDAAGSAEHV